MASVHVYRDGERVPVEVDGRTYRELTGMAAPGVVGADAWRDMVMKSVGSVQVGSVGGGAPGGRGGNVMMGGIPGGVGSGGGWTPGGSGGVGVDYDRVAGTAGDVDFGAGGPSAVDLGWISQEMADKVPNFFMKFMPPILQVPYNLAKWFGAFSQGVPTGMEGGVPAAQEAYHQHAMNEIAAENEAAGSVGGFTGMQGGLPAAQAAAQAHAVNEMAASQGWVPPVAQPIDPNSFGAMEGTTMGMAEAMDILGAMGAGVYGGDNGLGGFGTGFGFGGYGGGLYGGYGGGTEGIW